MDAANGHASPGGPSVSGADDEEIFALIDSGRPVRIGRRRVVHDLSGAEWQEPVPLIFFHAAHDRAGEVVQIRVTSSGLIGKLNFHNSGAGHLARATARSGVGVSAGWYARVQARNRVGESDSSVSAHLSALAIKEANPLPDADEFDGDGDALVNGRPIPVGVVVWRRSRLDEVSLTTSPRDPGARCFVLPTTAQAAS